MLSSNNGGDWKFPEKWAGISINDYNTAIKNACKTARVGVADLEMCTVFGERNMEIYLWLH